MSFDKSINAISWSRFEECNPNSTAAFEGMCRMLFHRQFVSDTTILHSDPNNAGIEVIPVIQKDNNKRISFQSKYFTNYFDYNQLKASMEKVVTYYKNKIDVVYVYSNKNITITCDSYKSIEQMLAEKNIQLIPVTNTSILDQVGLDAVISSLYFQHHSLTPEWFETKFKDTCDNLGKRYNPDFNVEGETERLVNLFYNNDKAIDYVNSQKKAAITFLNKLKCDSVYLNALIDEIINFIQSFEDITAYTLLDCLKWSDTILENFKNKLETDIIENVRQHRIVAKREKK